VKATATNPETGTIATDTDVNHHVGVAKGAGLTPGFWKNNAANQDAIAWPRTPSGTLIYEPSQTVGSVFDIPNQYASYADVTLEDALDLNGGGVNALLRHAVAALLNATQPLVAYPITSAEVIARTNAALASGSNQSINSLKDQFDKWNNLGADLDQFGRTSDGRTQTDGGLAASTHSEIDVAWLVEAAVEAEEEFSFFDPASGLFVPSGQMPRKEVVLYL
jgi:hypothetical protein